MLTGKIRSMELYCSLSSYIILKILREKNIKSYSINISAIIKKNKSVLLINIKNINLISYNMYVKLYCCKFFNNYTKEAPLITHLNTLKTVFRQFGIQMYFLYFYLHGLYPPKLSPAPTPDKLLLNLS